MAEETKASENVQAETTPEQPTEQVKTYTEQEYNALKTQLDTANNTIKSYEKMDIDGDKLIGGDDVVKQFREKYPDAFKSADTGGFIAPTGNSATGKLSGVEQAFYSMNPNLKS